ncbi:MAG: hypothetical protein ISR69_05125 [Gammaproteobacteria bacterium]|nr:hypothetical protein [Gammaproteobacteria bacterium]
MNESDWKLFKQVKEAALDKLSGNALTEVQTTVSDSSQSNYERFLKLYDLIKSTNKDIANIFDGHSRSRAGLQTMLMRSNGLISEEMVSKFSVEFQEGTKPISYE